MDMDLLALALRECVGRGRDIVLVSNGINTAAVRELMRREYGLEPRFIVDSFKCDGVTVFPPDGLPEGAEECTFLITAGRQWDRRELKRALLARVPEDRIVLLEDADPQWEAILADPDKVRLDFLGVGYTKCLTTSVYLALRENPNLYLSDIKESHFLDRRADLAGHEWYKAQFRGARDAGRLTGGIETQFGFLARRVREYYGEDVKLLFLLRDPLKALYSYFKMCVRNVYTDAHAALFREFGRVCPEMYDKWVDLPDEICWKSYRFGQSLQEYLKVYPREQLHAVLAEELVSDTQNQMHALQRFIGLPEEKCADYPALPRANEGKTVSRDYLCALANRKITGLLPELQGRRELIVEYHDRLRPKLWEYTQVEYNEPPLPETTARLREYFRDDVRLLEELLGRSLRGLWY